MGIPQFYRQWQPFIYFFLWLCSYFTILLPAQAEECNNNLCTYTVDMSQAGTYVAAIELLEDVPEGFWGLSVKSLDSLNVEGFNAGVVLKEQTEAPGFIGIYLAEPETIKITPSFNAASGGNLLFQIDKQLEGSSQRILVHGPNNINNNQTAEVFLAEPGFYVINMNNTNSGNAQYTVEIAGESFTSGINLGSWLDFSSAQREEVFGRFQVEKNQTVQFNLLFGSSYGRVGISQPHLKIYFVNDTQQRELFWTAPPPQPTPTQPVYSATPASGQTIDLGSANVGESISSEIIVREQGSSELQVNFTNFSGSHAGNFTLSPQTLILADGSSAQTLTVTCTPTAAGLHTAQLTLNTNDPQQATVIYPLQCTGIEQASPPVYSANFNAGAVIDFGAVNLNSQQTQSLTITNSGGGSLAVNLQQIGEDFVAEGLPLNLSPGSDDTVTLSCQPQVAGQLSQQLILTTNDPQQSQITYTLTCTGQEQVVLPPVYVATPEPGSSINFGETSLNTPVNRTLTIRNEGGEALTVNVDNLPDGFGSNGFPVSIDGGSSQTFTLICTPIQAGQLSGEFKLTTNDPQQPEITYTLECTGQEQPVSPPVYTANPAPGSVINFGEVNLDSQQNQSLTITNSGGETLTVSLQRIGENFVAEGLPLSLTEGESTTLTLTCQPQVAETLSEQLVLSSNDPQQLDITYTLECTGQEDVVSPPVYAANPEAGSTIDFGETSLNTPVNQTITVSNDGGAALTVDQDSIPDGFSSDGLPANIAVDGSQTLTLTCTPTQAGQLRGELKLTTNDPQQPDITYTLECTGQEDVVSPPVYAANPEAGSTIDFGETSLNTPVNQTITVSNDGGAALTVDQDSIPDGFNSDGLPANIAVDGSQTLTLTCTPTQAGQLRGELKLTTNDPQQPEITYTLECTGQEDVVSPPVYAANPEAGSTIDFGETPLNTSVEQTITVSNDGGEALTVNQESIPDGFSSEGLPANIAVDGSQTLTLTCTPTQAGQLSGELKLTTNDPQQPDITYTLECTGQEDVVSPPVYAANPEAGSTIDFGEISLDSAVNKTLNLRNDGGETLTVTLDSLTDGFSSEGLPAEIEVDGRQTLTLTCTPTEAGELSGELKLRSNDPQQPEITYTLTCIGQAQADLPPVYASTPAPDSILDLGEATVNDTVSQKLTLENAGGEPLEVSLTSIDEGFTLDDLPVTLEPEEKQSLTLQCTPETVGELTGELQLTSNDPEQPTLTYQLTCQGTQENLEPPIYQSQPRKNAQLAFGEVIVGETAAQTLTVTNAGGQELEVDMDMLEQSNFQVLTDLPIFINSNADKSIRVQCKPTVIGLSSTKLTLSTNDPEQSNVTYTLNCEGIADADADPTYSSNPQPDVTLEYGKVAVDSLSQKTLKISNSGGGELTVELAELESEVFTLATELPLTIESGQAVALSVNCQPIEQGEFTATLRLTSNDPQQSEVKYPLICQGEQALQKPVYTAQPVPQAILDFGKTYLKMGSGKAIQIHNPGKRTLVVNMERLENHAFEVENPFPLQISPGEYKSLNLSCVPEQLGEIKTRLVLTTNDVEHEVVAYELRCTGVDPATVTTAGFASEPLPHGVINFYNSFVDLPGVSQNITIKEIGREELEVDLKALAGDHADDFSIISPERFPLVIENGGSAQTIQIQCMPSDEGIRTATLQLTTNDPLMTDVSYTLECRGVPMF